MATVSPNPSISRVLSKDEVISHAAELAHITRKQCELTQDEEEFLEDHQTYPNFAKFLNLLKLVHQTLLNILVKSRKGKKVEQECREAKDFVFKLSDSLMDVMNQSQLQTYQPFMKTIVNSVDALQQAPKMQHDILLIILAYTKDLISRMSHSLEKISESELKKFDDVFAIVNDKLECEEVPKSGGNKLKEAFKMLKLRKNKATPVTHHVEQVLEPVPVSAGLPQDLIFLGTNGYLTALNLSSVSHMKKQEITKAWERNISSDVVFCLHPKCSALFFAYDDAVACMHADTGETVWVTHRSVVSKLATLCLYFTKIVVGSDGYVLCLDQASGKVLWETGLKDVKTVVLLPMTDRIIAATMGTIYALEGKQGSILWKRDLGTSSKGMTLASHENNLIVYNDGKIFLVDSKTGETKLETGISGAKPSLLVEEDTLFIASKGKAIALNAITLHEIWKNKMRGMGKTEGQGTLIMGDYFIVGTYGKVMSIDKKSGETVWSVSLPACGFDIVTLLEYKNRLLAASKGKLYELSLRTGDIIWYDSLKGYGNEYIHLGTYAPLNCTEHNSTPMAQIKGENKK